MNEFERREILEHCKWVDEVICPCPWIVTVDFLRKHNIHYVAHDDLPYNSAGSSDIYYDVKRLGMFRATQRTEGISTSDVILRIIKDYDMYVERSLQRGYKREDIGISAAKAFRIKLKGNIEKLKTQFIKDNDQPALKRSKTQRVVSMFQGLEYQTEQLWHDFANQFKSHFRETRLKQQAKITQS